MPHYFPRHFASRVQLILFDYEEALYRELRDGYVATETLVGHKQSELRSIAPLKEPSEDASRKISLRLAQAIINNTK